MFSATQLDPPLWMRWRSPYEYKRTDAVLDRVLQGAQRIELEGESMRRTETAAPSRRRNGAPHKPEASELTLS